MRTILIALSSIITVAATVPYLIEIVRGRTKPRVVSWFTWTILIGLGAVAAFTEHQIPAGVLMLCASGQAALVVVLGFRRGDHTFEALDIICLTGALVGLALWLLFDSPTIAVLATVIIDFTGAIPTFKHSWLSPNEETWITYTACSISGGITVLVANIHVVSAVAYPLYIFFADVMMTFLILLSPHRITEPAPVSTKVKLDSTALE
jgi:hypothetical protein